MERHFNNIVYTNKNESQCLPEKHFNSYVQSKQFRHIILLEKCLLSLKFSMFLQSFSGWNAAAGPPDTADSAGPVFSVDNWKLRCRTDLKESQQCARNHFPTTRNCSPPNRDQKFQSLCFFFRVVYLFCFRPSPTFIAICDRKGVNQFSGSAVKTPV